jgi:DNA-directed RNA polymerase specialized sigma24 family protein
MEELAAPPEPTGPGRLTHDEAQALVLRTVATQAESLLRTAHRHSLCADDAQDAYQRSMEIFMRRAPTLDPRSASRWLHVVVKHEAMEVRRGRSELVAREDVDFDRHEAGTVPSPEERTRAAEALRRLKPQELRALWLKALGHSYAEISEVTGFSATKVNRCLAEGRKSFLERFDGIESGEECGRWQPVLSAMIDGEASAAQVAEARPHLRNCPACRATLRGLHEAERPLAAVLPIGLVSAGLKLVGLVERILPGAASVDGPAAAAGAGGAGLLGLGGAKLAGLLAAGAAATASGGLVVSHEARQPQHRTPAAPREAHRAVVATTPAPVAATHGSSRTAISATAAPQRVTHRVRVTHRLVARRAASSGRVEFAPPGSEAPAAASKPAPVPVVTTASSAPAAPMPVPAPSHPDSTSGEFAPHP